MKKRIIGGVVGFLLLALIICFLNFYPQFTPKGEIALSDAQKFAKDYTHVSKENRFVYKTAEEALHILQRGSGVLFFGFPSCQRCQHYAPYLEEVAQQEDIETIFYVDIKQDRAENSENYQQIVALLEKHLLADNEGNPRIYVPDVTIVSNGEVLFHDNESSVATEEDGTPEEYRTPEKVTHLKERLAEGMKRLPRLCSRGCNE